MKELRIAADHGCWRVAFAFNTAREAVILVAGDKSGVSATRFYNDLLKRADELFEAHLRECRENRKPRCVALTI